LQFKNVKNHIRSYDTDRPTGFNAARQTRKKPDACQEKSVEIQVEILPEPSQIFILLLHIIVSVLVRIELVVGGLILHDLCIQTNVIVLERIFQMEQHGIVYLIQLFLLKVVLQGDEYGVVLLLLRFPRSEHIIDPWFFTVMLGQGA